MTKAGVVLLSLEQSSDAETRFTATMAREEEEEEDFAELKQLLELVNSNSDDPSLHFNLGALLWEKGEKRQEVREKSVDHLMIAAKLNPQNAAASTSSQVLPEGSCPRS